MMRSDKPLAGSGKLRSDQTSRFGDGECRGRRRRSESGFRRALVVKYQARTDTCEPSKGVQLKLQGKRAYLGRWARIGWERVFSKEGGKLQEAAPSTPGAAKLLQGGHDGAP